MIGMKRLDRGGVAVVDTCNLSLTRHAESEQIVCERAQISVCILDANGVNRRRAGLAGTRFVCLERYVRKIQGSAHYL